MELLYRARYRSPIGDLEIAATEGEVVSVDFVRGKKAKPAKAPAASPALQAAVRQLDEYFHGRRRVFELMLRLQSSEFDLRVWQALLDVGFGETASYGDIAKTIRRPQAARAVGGANHRNPISIIVPCHRIVGASGALTGYGGGLWRKEWLLAHEKKHR
jgi:methylated-DNA-[protein]-cysteine S-methyltransferase